jgi:hypothetical protein
MWNVEILIVHAGMTGVQGIGQNLPSRGIAKD